MNQKLDTGRENSLAQAASAYLRSAEHQPVAWMEWSAEAFARAQRENKPVLLDIGAVWCHWCHVMDRESYENAETAALINEHFVAVKVDRDERPDVDTRYQAAVASISGQGGWPLTAFLTPEGIPFFGGTYFPPDDRFGRPGFRRVLLTMAEAFQNRRAEVEESASSVLSSIQQNESFSAYGSTLHHAAGRELLGKLIGSAVQQFDARNGGFGSQPKFPHAGAIDLLIDAAGRGGSQRESPPAEASEAKTAGEIANVTLRTMADGGIYDHIGGGFHRYSVDERWHVPHFEKMAYDNSELLKTYVHAFQSFGEARFAEVAGDIVRWMDEVLSDRRRGGFYASQDADVSLDDDGDYFTWTEDEMRTPLPAEEFAAARVYFGLRAVGDMHHNPAKNVLRRMTDSAGLANALGSDEEDIRTRLNAALLKLAVVRGERPAPFVDRTIYTGWNGMCISAYLAVAKTFGNGPEVKEFALRSLDRVLAEAWDGSRGLAHVVAYGEGDVSNRRIQGVLEDYAFVAMASLDAWEVTSELRYFQSAQAIVEGMLTRFWDQAEGGFFDTEQHSGGEPPLGVLSARRKPLQDAPSPAGNPVAATVLLRLAALTGEARYESCAQETLQAFAGVVEHFGLYAASYGLALRRMIEAPLQIAVVGDDALAEQLAEAAERPFAANKSVFRIRWSQLGELPPALAETLAHLPAEQGSVAVVCRGKTCLPPARSVEELRLRL